MARIRLGVAWKHQNWFYDKKDKRVPLQLGGKLWLKTENSPADAVTKLHRGWTGSYEVTEVLAESTCAINDFRDDSRLPMVVYYNCLKPVYDYIWYMVNQSSYITFKKN